jgi:UDP-N-acetylmuramoyl-tripeptide--D-alanyl-D-alanine ligase
MRLIDSPATSTGVRVPPTIPIDELLAVTRGRLLAPTETTSFSLVSVDSRHVIPGSLFVALRGERVDGHGFVADALAAGAAAALVAHPVPAPIGCAVIQVADPLTALQELAASRRRRSSVRVVGITGSTGKTIAKEVVADVLARAHRVLRNEGNLNSETGLPMTLMRLDAEDEIAVLEMSMYTEGEIARLAEIAEPEVGVVLAVHPTHLQRAGSIEAIARAKAELPAALPPDGLAVLNVDDPRVAAMRSVTRATVRTVGVERLADVRARDVVSRGLAGTEFRLETPWGERRVRSALPGRHLVLHALVAAAVAERFDVPLPEVAAALEAGSRAEHRMAIVAGTSGATLVDDTYNASPVSVAAALDFLAETPVADGGRRIAVLGDMLELGPDEEALHREIGRRVAATADALVAVGERGAWIAEAARANGLTRVVRADDAEAAALAVERELAPGPRDIVLVKASRGIGLERTVELLGGLG